MGNVFGAYTDIAWTNNRGWVSDGNGNTFFFSLRDDFNFVKFKCLNKSNEVLHHSNYLTCIGYGANVFYIYDDCNIIADSHSCLGYNGHFE